MIRVPPASRQTDRMWRAASEMNYLVEDFLEESKQPSLCLDCFIKLKVGVTDAEKPFLLSEEVSTLMNQEGMYFAV